MVSFHLLALIYMIPSIIMYLIILYVILFSSGKFKFQSSFYHIYAFSAVNYVVHAITYWIIYRLTVIMEFASWLSTWPQESVWYLIVYILMYYTAGAIHTYSLALSFNRFTVFTFQAQFTIFWKKYLKYFLIICVAGPLIFVWNFPFLGVKNMPTATLPVNIAPTITTFVPWWNRSQNLFIEIITTSTLSLIMDIYVIYRIIKWRYMATNEGATSSNNHTVSSQDSMMLVYSLLVFATEAFSCSQQLMLSLNREAFLGYVKATQFILADVSALAPAWFILAVNKQLRQEAMSLFFGRKSLKTVSIASTTKTASRT